jgi:hypothetical protein
MVLLMIVALVDGGPDHYARIEEGKLVLRLLRSRR